MGAPGPCGKRVRSQNGKRGTGKLVAKHSARQGLGDKAQKGTVSTGLAMRLALPLQRCACWEEVSSGGVPAVQRVQCVSLQCRGGAILLATASAAAGVDIGSGRAGHAGAGWAPSGCVQCPSLEWVGMGRSSVSAVSEGNQDLLAQGVGLPSDCAAEGRCCATRRSALGLCSAAAPRGGAGSAPRGMSALQRRGGQGVCVPLTQGWAVPLFLRGAQVGGSAPRAVQDG